MHLHRESEAIKEMNQMTCFPLSSFTERYLLSGICTRCESKCLSGLDVAHKHEKCYRINLFYYF